jgi:hypothetical protein
VVAFSTQKSMVPLAGFTSQGYPGANNRHEQGCMIAKLRTVLLQVHNAAGVDFTGVGVLVCDAPNLLPIVPLRPVSTLSGEKDLVGSLAAISVPECEYHDGFHIVSSDWRLVRVSQYFSPPIVAGARIDRTKVFGGRYLAALFGSAIHGVQLAGIASRGFGIAIFKDGSEQFFEPLP